MEFFSTSSRQANQEAIQEMQADLRQKKTPAVRLVSEMIQMAMAKQASDIHIEPRAADTVVRMRVDGVLRDLQAIPRALQNFADFPHQDSLRHGYRGTPHPSGRPLHGFRGQRQMDLRVSTLPTQYGEKVVIRLLEIERSADFFSDLGMPDDVSEDLWQLLSRLRA